MVDQKDYIADLYRLWGANRDSIYKLERRIKTLDTNMFLAGAAFIAAAFIFRKQENQINTLAKQVEELTNSKGV